MASYEQLALLKSDVKAWNRWRSDELLVVPDLREADLSWSNLVRANLAKADLTGAQLRGANLFKADLDRANLKNATLDGACLEFSTLVESNLCGAILRDCEIYATSVWSVKLSAATIQSEKIGVRVLVNRTTSGLFSGAWIEWMIQITHGIFTLILADSIKFIQKFSFIQSVGLMIAFLNGFKIGLFSCLVITVTSYSFGYFYCEATIPILPGFRLHLI